MICYRMKKAGCQYQDVGYGMRPVACWDKGELFTEQEWQRKMMRLCLSDEWFERVELEEGGQDA